MKRILVPFIYFPLLVLAGIEPNLKAPQPPPLPHDTFICNFENEPSAVVGNVNVITGDYVDFATDLVVPGPEPLVLERAYCSSSTSGNLAGGWSHNLSGYFFPQNNPINYSADFIEIRDWGTYKGPFNSELLLRCTSQNAQNHLRYFLDPRMVKMGFTNCGQGQISGRNSLRNIGFSVPKNEEPVTMHNGTGSHLLFQSNGSSEYRLDHEIKANGNKISYFYNEGRLSSIEGSNNEGQVFSWIKFKYPKKSKKDKYDKNAQIEVETSDGRKVYYECNNEKKTSFLGLDTVRKSLMPIEKYSTESKREKLITKKSYPENRYVNTEYYIHPKETVGEQTVYLHRKDPRFKRVKSQLAPLGKDANPIEMRRFVYRLDKRIKDDGLMEKRYEGKTYVYDALNNLSSYKYSDSSRLSEIKNYTGRCEKDYKHYKTEHFIWGENLKWSNNDDLNESQLVLRGICDSDNNWVTAKSYKYDSCGNISEETIFGNLTGKNEHYIELNKKSLISDKNKTDSHKINYSYNTSFNKVTEERHPNNKTISYTYLEKTDLLKSKFTKDADSIKIREFFKYNKDAVLIKKTVDDGSKNKKNDLTDVQHRRITYIIPKEDLPCRGYPLEIIEKYLDLDSGQEKLLHRIKQVYDNFGQMLSQTHFDANDQFQYTLTWKYDDLGNVVEEVDALGNTIYKQYDANKNLIYQRGPRQDFVSIYKYDFCNRLLSEEIIQDDGTIYTTSYEYDYLGNRTASIDLYGNRTEYDYDEFSRVLEIRSPSIVDENENTTKVTEKFAYDILGNVTQHTDTKGNITTKKYNIRGQVTKTIYADGRTESNIYDTSGNLQKHIAVNGVTTCYSYDYLNRLINKKILSPDKQVLSTTKFVYNSLHLIQEIDEKGVSTFYKYDGADRLVETRCEEMRVTKHYNSQGFVAEERNWLSDTAYLSTIRLYDLVGHVIEERTEDQDSVVYKKVQMEYDVDGNCVKTIYNRNSTRVFMEATFDVFKRPLSIIDFEGNQSSISYDPVMNELGQIVLQKTATDALGNKQIELFNAIGKLTKTTKVNKAGVLLQQRKFVNDVSGNLIRSEDSVLPSDKVNINKREYDKSCRLLRLVQGLNTPEEKVINWTYNPYGQKSSFIKSDDVSLQYTYDWEGRLKSVISSDNTIHYEYFYDVSGLPIKVKDVVHNTVTKRSYDLNKRLKQEVLAHGSQVDYTYDAIGRPLTITHSDRRVVYTYQGPHMRSVERQTLDGVVLYKHTYDDFDLTGALLKATLANDCGTHSNEYDNSGRITQIQSSFFEQNSIKYDPIGNIVSFNSHDAQGTVNYAFQYDDLYQLTHESGDLAHDYNFDSLYNRLQKDDKEVNFNALNQLQSDDIKYDKNGNIVRKGSFTFEYDAWDRLVRASSTNMEATYTYDELNRRLTKIVKNDSGTTTEKYLYHDMNEVGHMGADNKIVSFRVLGIGLGAEIGASVAMEINDEILIPIHDHNGNIVALSDGETHHYSSFGEVTIKNKTSVVNAYLCKSPWGFASKRYDPETNLVYFGRRFYDPSLGRWLSPDPTGERDSPNLYAYVLNSPRTHFDLYGLSAESMVSSAFESLCEFGSAMWSGAKKAAYGAGKLLHDIGDNCAPPLVRDGISYTGHCMMGKDPRRYEMSWRRMEHSFWEFIDLGKQRTITLANGILNNVSEAKKRVVDRALETDSNGIFIYLGNNGFLYDTVDALLNVIGITTHSTEIMQGGLQKGLELAGPQGKSYVEGHSRGGTVFHNARNKVSEPHRIQGSMFGCPYAVPQGNYGYVNNYVSTRDGVALLFNPIQSMMRIFGHSSGNVTLIESRHFPFIDHAWEGKAYKKAMDISKEYFMNLK